MSDEVTVIVTEEVDTVVATEETLDTVVFTEEVSAGPTGPQGIQGIQGIQGTPGSPGQDAPVFTFVHVQSSPQAVWTVTHNLSGRPNVTVVDSAQNVVEGDIVYLDDNSLEIHFSAGFAGRAYLS